MSGLEPSPSAPRGHKKILVTGSSGFIARYVVQDLIARGHEVRGLDLVRPTRPFGSAFTFKQGDIRDGSVVDQVMAGVDRVVHLAAEHQDFGVPTGKFFDVNVGGMEVLLDAAGNEGVRDFFFYSSVAVYGDQPVASHEDLTPSPENPYGASKLGAEELGRRWVDRDSFRRLMILRPTVIYGPHNRANMHRLITQIDKGRYIQVGSGGNIKSIGYVENISEATIFLLERMTEGVQVFNYVDGPDLTSREIVEIIAAELGRSLPPLTVPRSLAMLAAMPLDAVARLTRRDLPITAKRVAKFTADTIHSGERLRDSGFQPMYDTREGLRRMVSWYLSETREAREEGT